MKYKNLKVYPHIAKVIPLAFDESLSYYECICNITNHINNEIIPIVNESNEMVYNIRLDLIDLKNYVDENMLTKDVNDLTYYTLTSDLSTVALTGDYDDLINKPTIPDVSNFITKDVNDLTYYTLTSNLSTVATTGSYTDLSNTPTIPDVSNFITKDVNDLTYYTLSSNLSTVATTGSYTDLSNKPTIPTVPTNVSAFNNDSGYITKSVNDLTNYTLSSNLSSVATTGSYNDLSNTPTIPTVPTNISAFNNDSGYITKSVNDLTNYTLSSSLSTVATTGSYTDLSNKPTLPTKTSDLNNDSGFITKSVNDLTNYTLSSSLSSVATSGSYNDLSNKPTILEVTSGTWTPVMENATVTYSKRVGTYKKIDKIVFINCLLEGTITASSSPYYAIISGLPFAPNNKYSGNVGIHYNCCVNDQNQLVRFYNDNNAGKIELSRDNAAAGSDLAQWNSGLGTFYLYITGFYFID